jgi:hypothetical protein
VCTTEQLGFLDAGGNPDSNTLLSDMATVICLDDYHCLDRNGRKEKGVTALDPKAQDFELMYNQIKDIRDGKSIDKPIYNHVSGLLDPAETIKPPKVIIRPFPCDTAPDSCLVSLIFCCCMNCLLVRPCIM